jgi:hypothetical protein
MTAAIRATVHEPSGARTTSRSGISLAVMSSRGCAPAVIVTSAIANATWATRTSPWRLEVMTLTGSRAVVDLRDGRCRSEAIVD